MMEISAQKHRRFAERFIGTNRPVLLEYGHPGMPAGGFTDNYLRVETDLGAQYDNTIRNMTLGGILDDGETMTATLQR